jgi:hypothetical protein
MGDVTLTETSIISAALKLSHLQPSVSALTTNYVQISLSYSILCFVLLVKDFFG